jgi:hypothetical protein
MTIGRRGFLLAGSAVAGAGLPPATQAVAAPMAGGRSVTEFGVVPNSEADQTKALQKAIEAIAAAGEAVRIPGGTYRTAALELPQSCAILGVPHQTRLLGQADGPILRAPENASLYLSGLSFEGDAIAAAGIEGAITFVTVRDAKGSAIKFGRARAISVANCRFERCAKAAIEIATDPAAPMGAIVIGNQISGCAIGIGLSGNGNVSGNLVAGASAFGLRFGANADSGTLSATTASHPTLSATLPAAYAALRARTRRGERVASAWMRSSTSSPSRRSTRSRARALRSARSRPGSVHTARRTAR